MSLYHDVNKLKQVVGGVGFYSNDVYELPKPTLQQVIDWLDYERLPEIVESFNTGKINLTVLFRPNDPQAERRVKWCQEKLDQLQVAYERGEIDADTYQRLTTVQNYSDDHLRKLRETTRTWRPSPLFMDINHTQVYALDLPDGAYVNLYLDGDQWRRWQPSDPA